MRIDQATVRLPAEEGVRVVALGLLSEARDAAERLRAGGDDEALHDFRVAVRRLRSALRAFRPWLKTSLRRRYEKRLRDVARSTNAARDAEVQLAWIAKERAREPSERRRVGYDLMLERYRARAGEGASPRVADEFLQLAERLDARLRTFVLRVGETAGSRFGGALAALLAAQLQALTEAMAAIQGSADEPGIHGARIEGKRLRYLLEPLRGYRRADAADSIDRLKRLQDLLGDLHDTHVLAAELKDAFTEMAAAQARRALSSTLDGDDAAAPRARRGSPRSGLVALAERVGERREALHAELARDRAGGGMEALIEGVQRLIAALAPAASREARRKAARATPARRRHTGPSASRTRR